MTGRNPSCLFEGLDYPAYPGRQYKAVPSAWAPWKDGRYLVGTLDGMLAVVTPDAEETGGSVFSLGTAAPNGPVHSITVSLDGSRPYGVAGDRMDLEASSTMTTSRACGGREWSTAQRRTRA